MCYHHGHRGELETRRHVVMLCLGHAPAPPEAARSPPALTCGQPWASAPCWAARPRVPLSLGPGCKSDAGGSSHCCFEQNRLLVSAGLP